MRKTFIGVFLVVLAGLVDRASAEVPRVPVDGVAAYVNENVITIGEALTALEPVRRQFLDRYEGDELTSRLEAAYGKALESLIERQLILAAFKAQGGAIPQWAVDNRVEEVIDEEFGGDREALNAALARDRLTFQKWRDEVREHIIIASMRSAVVSGNVRVSPSAIQRRYDANKASLTESRKVRLRMIVLNKSSDDKETVRARAGDILARARKGDTFAAIALAESEGGKKRDGGDWGWIDPDEMLRPELAAAANALAPGEMSEIVETEEQLYILKVEGRQAETVKALAAVRDEIEAELRFEEANRLYDAWIVRLRKKAYIKILSIDLF